MKRLSGIFFAITLAVAFSLAGSVYADIGDDLAGLFEDRSELQMSGIVEEIEQDRLTIRVGEEEYTVHGEPGQFAQLQEGERVQLTVVPQREGDEVHRTDIPDPEYLYGEVDEVRENVLVIQDQDGMTHEIRMDEDELEGVGPGQRVIIELDETVIEVEEYRAVDVETLQDDENDNRD